ncbi:hypothetical protein AB0N23_00030 [Streptomyces sp. NPDC052644]
MAAVVVAGVDAVGGEERVRSLTEGDGGVPALVGRDISINPRGW